MLTCIYLCRTLLFFAPYADFLKKVNLTISCTICLMLFVLGLSVGYNPLIVGNLGSFGGQALLLSVAGITGSVLLARVVYLLFFKEGGEK